MKILGWQPVTRLATLLKAPPLDPVRHERSLKLIERDLILPAKAVFIAVVGWYLCHGPWLSETGIPRSVTMEVVKTFFYFYLVLNVIVAGLLIVPRRWPLPITQWAVFSMSLVDSLFVAALTLVTGGFDSLLYLLFLALVVRNALSVPLTQHQVFLNLAVAFSYMLGGLLDILITREDFRVLDEATLRALELELPENLAETFLMRLLVILFLSACCYGIQLLLVLYENERRAAEEKRESASRQGELRAAGRLAAEIAHKIKNPLGIINNAAFTVQRALEQDQKPSPQQIQIIREEVDRADRIITELMGYAQLAEGQVEKLNVVEELNRALTSVFPPGARYSVQIHTDFATDLPALLMQRNHFSDMVGNVLVNAREALAGLGQVHVRAWAQDETLFISIKDDGPGIPPERAERVFEPYFTTKEKGTGLGLSIVRHHAEMYQGKVHLESKPGEATTFVLELPTRTFMKKRP